MLHRPNVLRAVQIKLKMAEGQEEKPQVKGHLPTQIKY